MPSHLIPRRAFVVLFVAKLGCLGAETLPVTPVETLSGLKLEFPTALAGKRAVCVFGFSKEAGDKTKIWMTHLNADGFNAWSIANLEGAPALVRGMIRSSMRKGTAAALLNRSLIMTKDEKEWKRVLAVQQDKDPVVVVLDASGNIQWSYQGVFADQPYRELQTRVSASQ